eukprot:2882016-Amphidinium_carterae.1
MEVGRICDQQAHGLLWWSIGLGDISGPRGQRGGPVFVCSMQQCPVANQRLCIGMKFLQTM